MNSDILKLKVADFTYSHRLGLYEEHPLLYETIMALIFQNKLNPYKSIKTYYTLQELYGKQDLVNTLYHLTESETYISVYSLITTLLSSNPEDLIIKKKILEKHKISIYNIPPEYLTHDNDKFKNSLLDIIYKKVA